MILSDKGIRESISLFLRPTESLYSFFEVSAYIKEKNSIFNRSYVAIIRHNADSLSGYIESALFLFCVKKPMIFVILKVIEITKGLEIKIKQKDEKRSEFMIEASFNNKELLFSFSKKNILYEFIRDTHKHIQILDNKRLYITNQNFAWLSFYKSYAPNGDEMLSLYDDDFSDSLISLNDYNKSYFSKKIHSYIYKAKNYKKFMNTSEEYWVYERLSLQRSSFIESRDLRIKICTWNVNGKGPIEDLSEWLLYKVCDQCVELYAIGLQEVDLSTEAYLRNDNTKENLWDKAIISVLGDHYEKIVSKQLVGILLFIYAHKIISPSLTSVMTSFVGCGIMGIMGNKGAVAVRLTIWDTVFCFVNSHLAAMKSQVERRNQDFHEICRRLQFYDEDMSKNKKSKSLFDCDHLIWCGDLNYRIDMSIFSVKELLEKNEFDFLLEFDQLNIQKRSNRCFEGFNEEEIKFPPTFKYKIGSSWFDSSEKMRVPSWTDRILWKSNGISVKNYRSYMNNVMSDHKPVSVELDAKIEILLVNNYLKLKDLLTKEYQNSENKRIPMVNISLNFLDFKDVVYLEPKTKVIKIDNIGQVTAEFEFIPKRNDKHICKPWIWPCPRSGIINPGNSCYINLTVFIDNISVSKLNSGEDSLEDILILHLKNGADFFILIQGVFSPTCFGMSLEQLSRLNDSQALPIDKSVTNAWSIPKEILRMTEYLLNNGKNVDDLFFTFGSAPIMAHIRDALNTQNEFKDSILENKSKHNLNVISMAETLLLFLDALPNSVIPISFYNRCLRASFYKKDSIMILDILPSLNANLFIYMVSFMRDLSSNFSLDSFQRILLIFSSILMRSSSDKTEQDLQRQVAFLKWFLTDFS
ncbi:hypothetical protein PNEG_03033 [Pneumocystis murina B123]|uniref:Rho-GAP domain-containing protein n=1 Tax=Pneumocystis murina (strain B123) TaxID=1069680 RepID=M7NMU7_PNEMU|nr:hypothetical protein PNEG_03033 [Pneumocystis murina B123]EMR08552.1 hypothetical protein PNEG_03033 [Pneumocystis murina B123]